MAGLAGRLQISEALTLPAFMQSHHISGLARKTAP